MCFFNRNRRVRGGPRGAVRCLVGLTAWLGVFGLGAQSATAQCWEKLPTIVRPSGSFGRSVALFGDTLVVGAQWDDENGAQAGAAYVFARNLGGPNQWGEVTKLLAADGAAGDWFGTAVSISGDTIVVGAKRNDEGASNAGAAYVFERHLGGAGNWGESIKLLASDGDDDDWFGSSVSVSGDTLVVGAIKRDSAYVFDRDLGGAGNWGERAKLSEGAGQRYGASASMDGDTIVVGADGANLNGGNSGAAYVYVRDEGGANSWGRVATLLASDGGSQDYLGYAVAIHGDTVAAGAYGIATNSGAAYVFERNPVTGSWTEKAKLVASNARKDHRFGVSVSVFADRLVVGSNGIFHVGSASSGSAYVFERDLFGSNQWGESAMLFSSPTGYFNEVAFFGDTIVVGSGGALPFEYSTLACWDRYGASGASGGGCRATMYANGVASASAPSGFTLVGAYAEADKSGLFFFGTGGRQSVPWGNPAKGCTSVQGVAPPMKRGPLLQSMAGIGACNANFTYDLNAHWTSNPLHNPGAGATVQAQLWLRDPNSPCAATRARATTSLSDAIEFSVAP
jgi:hypothetical protein